MAKKPSTQVTLEENLACLNDVHAVLMSSGITPQSLAKQLKAELKATCQKAFNANGEVIYSKDMPDWTTRQKARIDACKLFGMYPKEQVEHSGNVTIEVATGISRAPNED